MAGIHIIPADDHQNVYEKVTTLLLSRIMAKPDLVVSVFAGTPAYGLYATLVARAQREKTDFTHVRFVVLDELVTPDGSAPFKNKLQGLLFDPLGIPPENLIWFNPKNDHQEEVRKIANYIGVAGIDVALLSTDSRGHMGFHISGADEGSHASIVEIENVERWRTDRAFTLGLRDILDAHTILLFATGTIRADAVKEIAEGTIDPAKPMSVLDRHNNVILVADRESFSRMNHPDSIYGHYAGLYIVDANNTPSGRTIVVVSPHPDDAPISVGGAMAMLSNHNRVVTAVMTTGHRAFIYGKRRAERIGVREEEVLRESRLLGSEPKFLRLPFYDNNYRIGESDIQGFAQVVEEIAPDWIFLPHENDTHPAHLASRTIVLRALSELGQNSAPDVEMWAYEGPWAVFNKDEFNAIFSLPTRAFERKLQAIRCHESQIARTPYDVAADSLARLRSALVPEFALSGFGERPPRLEQHLEIFHIETAAG